MEFVVRADPIQPYFVAAAALEQSPVDHLSYYVARLLLHRCLAAGALSCPLRKPHVIMAAVMLEQSRSLPLAAVAPAH